MTALADTLFGIVAIAMVGQTFYHCDNGNLHLYGFIGMALGAFVYQKYPGRAIRSLIARTVSLHLKKK